MSRAERVPLSFLSLFPYPLRTRGSFAYTVEQWSSWTVGWPFDKLIALPVSHACTSRAGDLPRPFDLQLLNDSALKLLPDRGSPRTNLQKIQSENCSVTLQGRYKCIQTATQLSEIHTHTMVSSLFRIRDWEDSENNCLGLSYINWNRCVESKSTSQLLSTLVSNSIACLFNERSSCLFIIIARDHANVWYERRVFKYSV